MKITFKAKIHETRYTDGTLARRYIKVPRITNRHFDLSEARVHPKYSAFANWDGFPKMLETAMNKSGRVRMTLNGKHERELWVDLTSGIPAGVTVDESSFLAVVTIEV